MKYVIVIFALALNGLGYSQQLYKDSLYSYKKVTSETHEFTTINDEKLAFDYYRSAESKGQLPLVICVHGGGFVSGERDSKGLVYFAKRLAARGYAVASVSYRLTMKEVGFGCDITAEEKKKAIDGASSDILRSLEHILSKDSIFKVDRNKVVLLGSSAGAETVLNLAFMTDYSAALKDFKFAGLVSMAGAIMDITAINEQSKIPVQLFHGTGDPTVPYSAASHHYCLGNDPGYLMLYGGSAIAERLRGLGEAYYFYSVTGGAHEWAGKPFNLCFNEIVDFLFNDVVSPTMKRQTERTIHLLPK